MFIIPPWSRFLWRIGILFFMGCAGSALPVLSDTPQDISLTELRHFYQKQQEPFPPLRGLMEIKIQGKGRFWAEWGSRPEGITINGFNLFGGALFDFEMKRGKGEDVIRFAPANGKGSFQGNREAFREYFKMQTQGKTKRPLRMEWLTLMDWIARGGTPDISGPYLATLEKQDKRFILYLFSEDGQGVLRQKLWIERRGLRVTEAFLFDSDGHLETHIVFSHYRVVGNEQAGATFPFRIQIEGDDFYGDVRFDELHVMAPQNGVP